MIFNNKNVRSYIGAIFVILICFAIVLSLIFLPIPAENKDIITLVAGAFITGTVMSISVITGNTETEMKEMEKKMEEAKRDADFYKQKLESLAEELKNTKQLLVQLQTDVIKELSILANRK